MNQFTAAIVLKAKHSCIFYPKPTALTISYFKVFGYTYIMNLTFVIRVIAFL